MSSIHGVGQAQHMHVKITNFGKPTVEHQYNEMRKRNTYLYEVDKIVRALYALSIDPKRGLQNQSQAECEAIFRAYEDIVATHV